MDAKNADSILILEDPPFIALDIEDVVKKIGFKSITTLSRTEDAVVWLETHTPTFAIIDVLLSDCPCVEVAQTLEKRAVPFVVYSAADRRELHSAFRKGVYVAKPCVPDRLIEAVCQSVPEVCAPLVHG